MTEMTPLHIYLLGDLRIVDDAHSIIPLNSPRAQSLLAYMVLHAGEPLTRRHLAFLLWSDSSEDQARSNLRKLLHDLRRLLPEVDSLIEAQGPSLLWRRDAPYTLDVADFERSVEQATSAKELQQAVGLYRGPLLQSCYDDWVLSERERLHQLLIDALSRLVELLENQGDYRPAIQYAQLLLQHDPLHEDVYRALMRLYALTDDRAAALHTFQTCATVLKRELDVEPAPATRLAYERLLHLETPAAAPPPLASVPLVGHGAEWARLLEAWKRACRGEPHWVILTGAPGIGKTRLTEELVQWASKQGLATASARCYAAEQDLGFGPLTTWLRARPLPELAPLWLSEIARLLPELLLTHPHLPPPGPLVEPWQRLRFFEALARAMLGHQPLLLVLDDLPFCDRDSLEWLHYLLRFAPQAALLLVSTMCLEDVAPDSSLPGVLATVRRSGRLTEMGVGPLSAEETVRLAASGAGRSLTEAEGAALYAETEGNPLFILEMLRSGPGWEPGRKALPRTIQAVIGARLAQLSPTAQEVARVAAVIGKSFALEVLAQASGVGEAALAQALGELRQRRIVRAPTEEGEYDFDHSQLREVVYGSLNPAERKLLHRKVAEALQAQEGRPNGRAGEVVGHLEQAGLWEQAVPYQVAAGDAARRRYANATAIGYYQKAVGHLAVAEQMEIRLRLGKVLELVGRWEEAEGEYRTSVALAEESGAVPAQAQGEMALGEIYHRKGLDDEALRFFQRALQRFQTVGDQAGEGKVLASIGLLSELKGDYAQALSLHEASLQIAEKLGNRYAVANTTGNIGVVYWRQGDYGRALECFDRQWRMADELGDLLGKSRAVGRMGLAYREMGDYARALSSVEQRIELSRQVGDHSGMSYAIGQKGAVLYDQGDYARALDQFSRQLQMAEELGALRGISQGVRHIGLIHHDYGDYAGAAACYASSLQIALRVGDRRLLGYAVSNLADNFADQDLGLEAEREYQHARTIFETINIPYSLCEVLLSYADLAFEHERYADAQELNTQAMALAGKISRQPILFRGAILAERLCVVQGQTRKAKAVRDLENMLEEWKTEEQQASLYYELWRLEPDREEWRKTAAKLYRKLYVRTPNIKSRKRYVELTGSRLTEPEPLPELPAIVTKNPPDTADLLAQVDTLLSRGQPSPPA